MNTILPSRNIHLETRVLRATLDSSDTVFESPCIAMPPVFTDRDTLSDRDKGEGGHARTQLLTWAAPASFRQCPVAATLFSQTSKVWHITEPSAHIDACS